MDKYPAAKIAEISLRELMDNCKETFDIKRNSTMDRFRFLSRKQMPAEKLEQFWHSLNGMAAECDFGGQTESLVHDVFILNMRTLRVQEKLCTEPKATPKEALEFAIAFEEGSLRQKSYGESKIEIKTEPVCNVNKRKNCPCCGMENFTMDHLKVCRAKGKQCNRCEMTGHFGKVCKRVQKQRQQKQLPRRVNLVEEEQQKSDDDDSSDEQYVLGIDGGASPPFLMKR